MGGNSLSGLDLLACLEKALGVRLPVAMLFTHPTIADQAPALAMGRIPGLCGDCLSLREMALQLGEQGRRIAHLMLIDSFPTLAVPRARRLTDRLRWVRQRILFHLLTLPLLHP
ncbi:acyl carrier protein [bacterium]|nr:acyl carrier protein [bacterium]